jgi:hypothetical protein
MARIQPQNPDNPEVQGVFIATQKKAVSEDTARVIGRKHPICNNLRSGEDRNNVVAMHNLKPSFAFAIKNSIFFMIHVSAIICVVFKQHLATGQRAQFPVYRRPIKNTDPLIQN